MATERLWTKPFILTGSINFFQLFSQYVLVTTLPLCIMDVFGGSELEAGLAMTFFQIGTSTFRPIAGYLVDQQNKRRLLFISLTLFLLVMGAFNEASKITDLYGLRLVHGIVFALATTTAASISVLVIPPGRRGEGIGYFSVTTNMAMVVGPLAGLLLYQYASVSGLFLTLTAIAALILAVTACVALPKAAVQPVRESVKTPFLSHFIEKRSLTASFLGGLVFFAYGGVLTFIPLYAASLGMASNTGLFFAVFALVIVVSRPVVGNVLDRIGPSHVVYPGFILFIAGFVLFGFVSSPVFFLVSAAVLGLGFGALSPVFQTLAIQSVPPSRSGAATATYYWFLDIFVGLAAMTLGIVAQYAGYSFLYGCLCPALMALTLFLYYRFYTKRRAGKN